ncbi:hypothetical protein HMPREF1451_00546 [Helicobacter pylori HP260BFii]|uniref:Uncharacterized protein n=1 Tax=Helicobacter pylori GAM260BSi TaxID=1159046 RepID=M3QZ86_HELPX|nr:hypothetical protein HMPREF1418_00132 [Helicobacter pylori GAM260BSi]EMH41402.1 hypothetical protein HMPREF1430_01273 [Helicobacter pylori GAM96Ai]EMH68802.1 hypothetical protein HMPREF1451_00546 [Helicobacter pylori HP260BFii]
MLFLKIEIVHYNTFIKRFVKRFFILFNLIKPPFKNNKSPFNLFQVKLSLIY